jgi:protein-tyrosine-phosphatase
MTVHFICRGNALRSVIGEAYLKSLQLKDVHVMSSGTSINPHDAMQQVYFLNTIKLLEHHGIARYAKAKSEQLTQKRIDGQDITICMNQVVIDEAERIVKLPCHVINWNITDIGEGDRVVPITGREPFEEEIYNEITAKVDELVTTYRLG